MATTYTQSINASFATFIRQSDPNSAKKNSYYISCGNKKGWNQYDVGLIDISNLISNEAGTNIVVTAAYLDITTHADGTAVPLSYSDESGYLTAGALNTLPSSSSTWNNSVNYMGTPRDYNLNFSRGSNGTTNTLNIINTIQAIIDYGSTKAIWLGNSGGSSVSSATKSEGGIRVKSSSMSYLPLTIYYYLARHYYASVNNSSYVSVAISTNSTYDGNTITLYSAIINATGYTTTLNGWYLNSQLRSTNQNLSIEANAGNAGTWIASASRTANTYTIVYNGNNATSGSMNTSYHTYDTYQQLNTNNYSRIGYNFLGWSTSSTASSPMYTNQQNIVNLSSTQNAIVTLYAVWSPIQFTINYDGNGNTDGQMNPTTYTYDVQSSLTPNSFIKTGYSFIGWSTSSTASTATYTDGQDITNLYNAETTTTLYALWDINTYELSFSVDNPNYGSVQVISNEVAIVSGDEVTYNTELNITATPTTLSGYTTTFNKFEPNTLLPGTESIQQFNMPASITSIMTYFNRVANQYTASFDATTTGGTLVGNSTIQITYDQLITGLPIATKLGFEFYGWNISSSATKDTTSGWISENTLWNIASDTTLYAIFTGSGRTWTVVTENETYKGSVEMAWDTTSNSFKPVVSD